jgi:hypothetical protein
MSSPRPSRSQAAVHVFSPSVANTAVMTMEDVLRRRPGVAAKLMAFLTPKRGTDHAEFRSVWDAQVPLVLGTERTEQLVLGYSHNPAVTMDAVSADNPDLRARVGIEMQAAG